MTAHRLQGATVDRTHVLGSDELYREWGYTALSRHRDHATFHVTSAEPQRALPGLESSDHLEPVDVRHLERSRAQQLASGREKGLSEVVDVRDLSSSMPAEARRLHRADSEHRIAAEELAAAQARIAEAERALAATGPFRRAARAAIETRLEAQRLAIDHWSAEITRTAEQLAIGNATAATWLEQHGEDLHDLGIDVTARSPVELIDAVNLLADARDVRTPDSGPLHPAEIEFEGYAPDV